MDISWLRRHYDNGDAEVAKRWDRVLQSLEAGLNFKRRVIENLRPTLLDNVGLVAALQWLVDEGVRRAGVDCEEEYPESLPELTPDASIAVFRIVQECLMNIMKHARATQVHLGVVSDERQLAVTVRDNGVGIDEQRIGVPRSHGILGMRHRVDAYGGELQIRSLGPGIGTEVAFALPWDRIRHVERDQLAE
jgi:signal transduction histidine kinase